MTQAHDIQDVLEYWYSPRLSKHWFASTPALDDEIRQRYEALWQRANNGELDAWSDTPDGALALAIVLDQLPLNMYRGKPTAFATEQRAVTVARQAIARGDDQRLPRERVQFLYMPLMHSENLAEGFIYVTRTGKFSFQSPASPGGGAMNTVSCQGSIDGAFDALKGECEFKASKGFQSESTTLAFSLRPTTSPAPAPTASASTTGTATTHAPPPPAASTRKPR